MNCRYGYIHSCPTNLGTGMRASVHVDLPGRDQGEKVKEREREMERERERERVTSVIVC